MTNRRVPLIAIGAALAIAAAGAAAQNASVLAQAAPGLWELDGVPEARGKVRQCFGKLSALVQYEHRSRSCKPVTLSDSGKTMVVHYTCAGSDFGRTSVKVITPRNIKVDTQGISDGLPFAYTIEARRVGECKAGGSTGGVERGH